MKTNSENASEASNGNHSNPSAPFQANPHMNAGSKTPAKKIVLAVLAHPNPESFCAALFREFCGAISAPSAELADERASNALGASPALSDSGALGASPDTSPHLEKSASPDTSPRPESASPSTLQLHPIDLYSEGFDPVMDRAEMLRHIPLDPEVLRSVALLGDCAELAVFFPDWWGAEPAVLKGFFDRLFRPSVVYERDPLPMNAQSPQTRGLMPGCRLSVWITSDNRSTQRETVRSLYEARFGFIAEFCAFRSLELMFHAPLRDSTLRQRKQWLAQCRGYAQKIPQ